MFQKLYLEQMLFLKLQKHYNWQQFPYHFFVSHINNTKNPQSFGDTIKINTSLFTLMGG